MFKAIKEKKTCIKAQNKASANFASIKSNAKPKRQISKEKKKFFEWPKSKKCGYKHLANQVCKNVNDKYDKCHKKGHIAHFHDIYTFPNKEKI